MKSRLLFFVLVLAVLLGFNGSGYAEGQTLNVPDEFTTLQEAINAAEDGDTIVVAEGTYKGNITFKGKSLTLTSDSANTIIEGTEAGSVVTIDSNSTISGFTITSHNINARGIYVKDASPTIENCSIIGNEAGGIYSTDDSQPQIVNCIIIENSGTVQVYGGTPQISFSFVGNQGLVNTTANQQTVTTAEIITTEPQPPIIPDETPPVIQNVHKIGRTEWVKEANLLHTSFGETTATSEGIKTIQTPNVSCSLQIAFERPTFTKKNDYDNFSIPELKTWHGSAGSPILPFKPMRILVPYGQKVTKIKVIPGLKQEISGKYVLEPAQQSVPLSKPERAQPTPPNPAIYNSDNIYPEVPCGDAFLQGKSGYTILIVNLFPFEYHPKSRKLLYYPNMTVEVETAPLSETTVQLLGTSAKEAIVSSVSPDSRIKDEISSIVDNPEVIETYETGTGFATLSGTEYKYVIIAPQALANDVSDSDLYDLRNSKITRGISATIVTTQSIYADPAYNGIDPQTEIRNFIIDYYQNHGTRYVLLAGDKNNVPPRMFWVEANNPPWYDTDYMPVDMYYGCLDGTFDYNGNRVYGEPNDGPGGGEVDLLAEVFVGRAPVATITEVSNFVRKSLTYENTTSNYLHSVYMLGEQIDDITWDAPYMEEIRLGSDANGYTTVGFENSDYADFFETQTLYDSPSYWWAPTELINIMNLGVHILNHGGHGSQTCMCSNKPFCTDTLGGLNNTDYFFIYSQTCDAGGFDEFAYPDDCFAEAVTTMQYGAFAVIMNARYGWYEPGGTDASSQRYARQFWDTFLEENISNLGKINQYSKENYINKINEQEMRWCYYELNLFGDPELSLKGVGTGRIWHVDDDAPSGGDGERWGTALKYLQDALVLAAEGDEIWVAEGTYQPNQTEGAYTVPTNLQEATFQLKNGVAIKGGYAGYYNPPLSASDPNDRDITNYQTILSGDLDNNDLANFVNYDNNSYHVVTGANNATVDGFIIEHGNADDGAVENPQSDWLPGGSGMYNENSSPIVNNCTFRNNKTDEKCGGAISNSNHSLPQITNCAFSNNRAVRGGAIFNYDSQQIINNCTFVNNFSHIWGGAIDNLFSQSDIDKCIFSNNTARYGGAIGNRSDLLPDRPEASMDITNCVFFANTVSLPGGEGGAVNNLYAEIAITNCTFTQNYAAYRGGAIHNKGGEPLTSAALINCILWGNTDYMAGSDEIFYYPTGSNPSPIVISHCNIKDSGGSDNGANWTIYFGIDAGGNIDAAPLFVNPDDPLSNGLKLGNGSPCIDAANDDVAPQTDILDQNRGDIFADIISGPPIADMGAYERRLVVWYVEGDAPSGGNGKTWETAFRYLQDALNNPSLEPGADNEIWVAQGTYYPNQAETPGIIPSNQLATFQLVNGVTIKGGYAGYYNPPAGSSPNDRDIANYQTILSGDIVGSNSYHVVTGTGVNTTAVIDGFTIRDGYACYWGNDNPYPHILGGGMIITGGSPTIMNCNFTNNQSYHWNGQDMGGAVFISSSSYPTFKNCIFYNNYSDSGAGIFILNGSAEITNCVFANHDNGGEALSIIYSEGPQPKVTNCTFYGNGTGLENLTSGSIITNCIFWGNVCEINVRDMYDSHTPKPTITYCDIEGGWTGATNIGEDPIVHNPSFVNTGNPLSHGLSIGYGSPCIDKANDSVAPDFDILNRGRVEIPDSPGSSIADIGAYEYVP